MNMNIKNRDLLWKLRIGDDDCIIQPKLRNEAADELTRFRVALLDLASLVATDSRYDESESLRNALYLLSNQK